MDEMDDRMTHTNSGLPQGSNGQVERLLNQVAPELYKRFVEIQA